MPKLFTKLSKIFKPFCLSVVLALILANNSFALDNAKTLKENSNFGLKTTAKSVGFGETQPSVAEIAGNIIGTALSLLGVIFMILIVYGGYMWMMARGNDSESDKAKEVLISATIGITIVFSAYVFTNYILTSLSQNIVSS